MVWFLSALILLLFAFPFVDTMSWGRTIEAFLLSIVFLSAIPAVGGRRASLIIALVLLLPALSSLWIGHLSPGVVPAEVTQGAAILFCGYIVAHLVRYIARAPRVDEAVLCAAAANYLLMAFLWAFAYSLVARINPHAFAFTAGADPHRTLQRFEALYFSFITLTTVGYGDIAPASPAARMLAIMEATAGGFYMAILVARLVSLYSNDRRPPANPAAREAI